jgi:hypothetical protein
MNAMRVVVLALAVSIGAGSALAPALEAQEAPRSKNLAPAAEVGGEVIPLEEVEQALRAELAKLEQQRFQLMEQKLEQFIGDRLLAQEGEEARAAPGSFLTTSSSRPPRLASTSRLSRRPARR